MSVGIDANVLNTAGDGAKRKHPIAPTGIPITVVLHPCVKSEDVAVEVPSERSNETSEAVGFIPAVKLMTSLTFGVAGYSGGTSDTCPI